MPWQQSIQITLDDQISLSIITLVYLGSIQQDK